MRLTDNQRIILRVGSALVLVGAAVLALFAVFIDSSSTTASDLEPVGDPQAIALPEPGYLGGEVTVYSAAAGSHPRVAPRDLGCRLLDKDGRALSQAKMTEAFLTARSVQDDGQTYQPLFTVGDYPSGARIACDRAAGAAPLAVSKPTAFGHLASVVRLFAAGTSVPFLIVGIGGWFAFRPRRTAPG